MPSKQEVAEAFIAKAVLVHGDRYTYSVSAYLGSRTPMQIDCKIHGGFLQTPYLHLKTGGCPKCRYEASGLLQNKKAAESFLFKASGVHGTVYSYEECNYVDSKTKVKISCMEHGFFLQIPASHLSGRGCPKCRYLKSASTQTAASGAVFVSKAVDRHGATYDYSLVVYVASRKQVKIKCKTHGIFLQTPSDHLIGKGCSLCGNARVALEKTKSFECFVTQAKKIHGDKYSYSSVGFEGMSSRVEITCKIHGTFTQQAGSHSSGRGRGCPGCKADKVIQTHQYSFEEYVKVATERHEGRYRYLEDGYTRASGDGHITIVCKEHGQFVANAGNHITGSNCPACSSVCSKIEKDIRNLLKPYSYPSDRVLIAPLELDIVRTDRKVAVEVNGLYWHSEKMKGKTYHKEKTDLCTSAGIRLIHIREDLWEKRKEQVTSLLLYVFNGPACKVYARKTVCKLLSSSVAKVFVDANHVQGWSKASVCVGLFYEGVLVSVATFCNKRGYLFGGNDNEYELVRFCSCSGTSVVGGLSKMLSFFLKSNEECSVVKSYCDLSLFTGKGYEAAGFSLSHVSPPDYIWFKGLRVRSRYSMQKHRLEKFLPVFDSSLTEVQNCEANGWSRSFGVGIAVYTYEVNTSY